MAYSGRGPTYKVVLLGELGVGKTSLFKRLKDNTFDEYQTATTGIDSCTKVMKVDGEQIMVSEMLRYKVFITIELIDEYYFPQPPPPGNVGERVGI